MTIKYLLISVTSVVLITLGLLSLCIDFPAELYIALHSPLGKGKKDLLKIHTYIDIYLCTKGIKGRQT